MAVGLLLLLVVSSMATLMMISRKGSPATAGHLPNPREGVVAQTPFPDPAKVAAQAQDPYIQSETLELLPDGAARFRLTLGTLNESAEPWRTYEIGNSDFVNVTNIIDARRRPVVFETIHQEDVLRSALTLNEPVAPGQKLLLTTEGIITGRVKPAGAPGLFEYASRHWPMVGHRTRRIELHLLPPGARVVDKQPGDLQERFRNGRAELFIDRLIPPGDSLEIVYRFRLDQSDKSAPTER